MSEFPFEHLVFKEPNSGCWLWEGPVNWGGYGQINRRGGGKIVRIKAHRLSYEWHRGPIPDHLIVLHKCDTPACVNPDHLRLGTFAENMADKVAKGRQAKGPKLAAIRKATCARGENAGPAKLTEAQVRAIFSDPRSGTKIGADYGIDQQTVSKIKRGTRWRHLGLVH